MDLGHEFFLTRLFLGEDCENVLRKGSWFIGDHFLSIKPWEPDFKLAPASVSSIAVWIRLNEFPIEYYNVEALQLIRKAIGNVLRLDTFMASKTRGRFARLCLQQICYEGIHKICFGCGHLGHRKEHCPYIIWQEPSTSEAGLKEAGETSSSSHVTHATNKPRSGEGTGGVVFVSKQSSE